MPTRKQPSKTTRKNRDFCGRIYNIVRGFSTDYGRDRTNDRRPRYLGLSCRTVPAPTRIASWMERRPCVIVRLSDPLRNTWETKTSMRWKYIRWSWRLARTTSVEDPVCHVGSGNNALWTSSNAHEEGGVRHLLSCLSLLMVRGTYERKRIGRPHYAIALCRDTCTQVQGKTLS